LLTSYSSAKGSRPTTRGIYPSRHACHESSFVSTPSNRNKRVVAVVDGVRRRKAL